MRMRRITEFYTSLLTRNDGSQEVGFTLEDNRKIETLYMSVWKNIYKRNSIQVI